MQSSKEKQPHPETPAAPARPARRGRPRDPARVQKVLDTAICHFQSQGFERTSIEAIARDSGVSKVTIYSYFPSKEALYGAAICSRTDMELGESVYAGLRPAEPRAALQQVGRQFLRLMRADEVIGKHRTLFSQASVQPELGRIFFEHGPQQAVRRLAGFLQACQAVGSLHLADAHMAAEQFLSLFLGTGHIRCLLGLPKPDAADDEALMQANVDLFLRAYAVQTTHSGDGTSPHHAGH